MPDSIASHRLSFTPPVQMANFQSQTHLSNLCGGTHRRGRTRRISAKQSSATVHTALGRRSAWSSPKLKNQVVCDNNAFLINTLELSFGQVRPASMAALVAALSVVVVGSGVTFRTHRPHALSWKRTQCGSPSGTHPASESITCRFGCTTHGMVKNHPAAVNCLAYVLQPLPFVSTKGCVHAPPARARLALQPQ